MDRILVATDESATAARAVEWAAEMATRSGAALILLRVLAPAGGDGAEADEAAVRARLVAAAAGLAGGRGRARVAYDADPAAAIVRAAAEEAADLVVVGSIGMSGRKQFLLGNVPNRVSHTAHCSVVIVKTSSASTASAGPVTRDRPDGDPTTGRLLGRAARIARVMARYGLPSPRGWGGGPSGSREGSAQAAASRLRDALEELGPTFAKLGQILSTRPDLLPPAFIEQLSTLQDRVKPLTEAEVVAVMEQELGVPWEDVFESIEPSPLAAGTIAQVHRALLADGERVVVKVQRPSADAEIREDLGLLQAFAREAAGKPVFHQVVDLGAMIEHLSAALRRELDFRHEAASMERMRAVLDPFPRLDLPRVHHEILTARLLVMEEVQGIPVHEAPAGKPRREAARQLLESYYRQVLTEGFFHADPHPGNLKWWNDKIYFLDFGMVGEIGPEVRELLLLLLLAFWREDSEFLGDILLMLGDERRPDLDVEAFQEELGQLIARYRHSSLRELRLGPLMEELTEISLRHDVRVPPPLALAGKALGQMQLVTAELDPTLDPFSVAGSFFFRQLTDGARELASPRRLIYEGQKLKTRLSRLVDGLERVVGARPGSSLQVEFRGTERVEATIQRAGRRVALAVAGGSALLAAAVAAASTHLAVLVPAGLGALGAVIVLGLLVDLVRPGD
jgi:predicted unusual protein kinase regulating ubiquinone biosynthesis (AarF/ABC1/UbiB family)/nucleotide-binding universal stress UspA family protein